MIQLTKEGEKLYDTLTPEKWEKLIRKNPEVVLNALAKHLNKLKKTEKMKEEGQKWNATITLDFYTKSSSIKKAWDKIEGEVQRAFPIEYGYFPAVCDIEDRGKESKK